MQILFTVLTVVFVYFSFWYCDVIDWSNWWSAPTMGFIVVAIITFFVLSVYRWVEWASRES